MERNRLFRESALAATWSAMRVCVRSVYLSVIAGLAMFALVSHHAAAGDDSEVKQILAVEADVDYGEYLAGECLTCHQAADTDSPVPKIHGRPAEFIISMLLAYRDGRRENETMQTVAKGLGQEEMASLGLYFSTLAEN